MTRLLIISDNHLDSKIMVQVLAQETYDYSIHLGDSQMTEEVISHMFDYYVGGNNDENFTIEEQVIKIEKCQIALCHGHTINCGFDFETCLLQFAQKMKAKIVFFGHLHVPIYQTKLGITLINPGSIKLPRQMTPKSYCLVDIDSDQIIQVQFKNVD